MKLTMPTFPKREADILALANQMLAGYTAHPAIFPHADAYALENARNDYTNQVVVQDCFVSAARIATDAKEDAYDDLVAEMKQQLKRSEVDTHDNPTALTLIGWDAQAASNAVRKPGQPRHLEATQQGPGTVTLDWKPPLSSSIRNPHSAIRNRFGAVRSYIVLRREQPAGQPFTDWFQAGLALETEITLTNQPRFIQLEYRIIAINASGVSTPSNVATVVL